MKTIAAIALLVPILTGCFVTTTIQGNGTVTSEGTSHFNCSTGQTGDCEEEYATAGSETFKATPGAGHTFAKWTNCPYESIETCKTSWNQASADGDGNWPITATFEEQNPPVEAALYTYNALGQRITKTVGGQTTIFQYDLDGNLMAEIDAATGQPVRQHIHVNGEPIAQLATDTGNGLISLQYIHTDHLGTPTLVTNQSGQVVADIEATPFGETFIDYAEVAHNRRFPGQFKDRETGLYYNYFRSYDPSIGRYVQADPIGMQGGPNLYGYVEANPLRFFDFYGLKITGEWDESGFEASVTGWDYVGLTAALDRAPNGNELVDRLGFFNFVVNGILGARVKCKETDECDEVKRRWTLSGSVMVNGLDFRVPWTEPDIPIPGMSYAVWADKILRVSQFMDEWRGLIEAAGKGLLNSPTAICKGSSFTL